jgi:hypothetical protein
MAENPFLKNPFRKPGRDPKDDLVPVPKEIDTHPGPPRKSKGDLGTALSIALSPLFDGAPRKRVKS